MHAQSPDLNHIKHLWAFLKQCLNKFTAPPRGIQGVTRPITKDFVGNSNKNWVIVYSFLFGFVIDFLTIYVM